jgi:hypothetical protein
LFARFHRLGGVKNEIEQDLLNEIFRSQHTGQSLGRLKVGLHFSKEPVAQEFKGVLDNIINITQGGFLPGIPAEAQHRFDNPGPLLDYQFDAIRARLDLVGVPKIFLNDLRGALDDRKNIIEVMCDAGCERA